MALRVERWVHILTMKWDFGKIILHINMYLMIFYYYNVDRIIFSRNYMSKSAHKLGNPFLLGPFLVVHDLK